MVYKVCVVPSCLNNSRDTPNKIFLLVPNNLEKSTRWAQALNVEVESLKVGSRYNVCEDHFDVSISRNLTNVLKLQGCLYFSSKMMLPIGCFSKH